ncbi:MAG: argininosuccinate lyase [Ardenticatenaceae bacterium]|nr:argininosuccinate lyase [Ardenticatenaceae bacterium]
MMSKLWGGRFSRQIDELVHHFNESLTFDRRLYDEDINGSVAWARGLVGAGVLTADEAETIVAGLEQVRDEFDSGTFVYEPADEDIHSAVERRLTELIGPVGGKLHTGRSRNDQVATDFRLWVMRACDELDGHLQQLQQALVGSAEAHLHVPLPGYTHLQHAQPITWGHWALSHFWPLARDRERLGQARGRTAVSPLGAAALAGCAFPIDRDGLAQALGFEGITPNSLDAVSDRDFVADFLYVAAMIGLHMSRISEQLILYSTAEFRFVRIDDGYSTGSSIMPQKKNADTLELTRGKSGRLLGNLAGMLATLKGLPSTYDKDLQEDKEPVFDAFDTLCVVLPVMAGLIDTLTINPQHMAVQLESGLLATDLADYLAKKGMPFREAHGVVGRIVRLAEERGVEITALSLGDLQQVNPTFQADVVSVLDVKASLASRAVPGGTAPEALAAQLQAAKEACGFNAA